MITIQAPLEDFDPDLRLDDCRDAMEKVLHSLITEAETKGWQPAEVLMALVDTAEDYVLALAENRMSKH